MDARRVIIEATVAGAVFVSPFSTSALAGTEQPKEEAAQEQACENRPYDDCDVPLIDELPPLENDKPSPIEAPPPIAPIEEQQLSPVEPSESDIDSGRPDADLENPPNTEVGAAESGFTTTEKVLIGGVGALVIANLVCYAKGNGGLDKNPSYWT